MRLQYTSADEGKMSFKAAAPVQRQKITTSVWPLERNAQACQLTSKCYTSRNPSPCPSVQTDWSSPNPRTVQGTEGCASSWSSPASTTARISCNHYGSSAGPLAAAAAAVAAGGHRALRRSTRGGRPRARASPSASRRSTVKPQRRVYSATAAGLRARACTYSCCTPAASAMRLASATSPFATPCVPGPACSIGTAASRMLLLQISGRGSQRGQAVSAVFQQACSMVHFQEIEPQSPTPDCAIGTALFLQGGPMQDWLERKESVNTQ